MQPLEREIHSNMLKVGEFHALIGRQLYIQYVIAYSFYD